MRIKKSLTAIAVSTLAAATFAVATPGTALADNATTTANEVAAALDKVDARDGNLVIDAVNTAAVNIPTNPNQGVQLTAESGRKFTVGLPNAKHGKGQKTRKGATAYAGSNGSANAVVPSDKAAQFLVTIENRKAPTSYTYPVDLPQGGRIEVAPGGTAAVVLDGNNALLSYIPQPWAKDASGKAVPTHFTTDGNTLTQHIAHKARGVQYPVVADPVWFFIPAWILRSCGVGFLGGWAGAWVSGDDMWRRLGGGVVGCLFGALGVKVSR